MKVRVISGIIAIALIVALLTLNCYFSIVSIVALCILSAFATYEILNNTGCVKNITFTLIAMLYSAAAQLAYNFEFFNVTALTVTYVIIVAVTAVFDHENFKEQQVTMAISMPIVITYAFSTFATLLNSADKNGILYFVMLINFSSVADTFAYFTGCAFGRHKLAPVVSPKKTIEGAIGGVIGSMLGALLITLIFEKAVGSVDINLGIFLAITPVLTFLGMLGDLFTSAIKRNYNIKDYGNLLPGHGGVLDRTDSLLLVAPVLVLLLEYLPLVK